MTSAFIVGSVCAAVDIDDDEGGGIDEGGGFGGELIEDDDDVIEVLEGVLERIKVFDLTFDFEVDESVWRGDITVFGLELFVVVVADAAFDVVWAVLAKRWEEIEDVDEELPLKCDVGLIERLRAAYVVGRTCCDPGTAGLGIKPKRVCIAVGGGGRFVIDICFLVPKILKNNQKQFRFKSAI